MAGGWDVDALGGQMEDAIERAQAAQERPQIDNSTPAVLAARTRFESLRLSYARTKEQLGNATNAAHRAMLEKALSALAAEMEANNPEG